MTRLYAATGEPRYRAWVKSAAPHAATDGPGLCAVYGLTGEASFLRAAERIWQRQAAAGPTDPELSAALWAVTGESAYLPKENAAPWVCPLSEGTLTYSRTSSGLAVNAFVPSGAVFGPVQLTQRVTTQARKHTVTLTVRTSRPATFTLRLWIPPGPGAARVSVAGAAQATTTPRGTFWASKRAWKDGDAVALTLPEAPSTAKPTGRS